jgi:hypothetical protein
MILEWDEQPNLTKKLPGYRPSLLAAARQRQNKTCARVSRDLSGF